MFPQKRESCALTGSRGQLGSPRLRGCHVNHTCGPKGPAAPGRSSLPPFPATPLHWLLTCCLRQPPGPKTLPWLQCSSAAPCPSLLHTGSLAWSRPTVLIFLPPPPLLRPSYNPALNCSSREAFFHKNPVSS